MIKLKPPNQKVRYAVIGAGWFGQQAVLPAFDNAKENSELAAIVSGDAKKREELSAKYNVPAVPYEDYDKLVASGKVDAVFIVTPNTEHQEHAVIAANRGVHVLCEKPLAESAAAAEQIIKTCEQNNVLLMTAYRLHFEKANLTAVELIQSGKIGEARLFNSVFTMMVKDSDNIRLDSSLGGGPLLDIGVYCVNASRYLYRDEPTEVTAFATSGSDPRFRNVPEMVAAILRFPKDRLATFTVGFGAAKVSACQVVGTKGDIRLDPAFSHTGPRKLFVTLDGDTTETEYSEVDQIAPELIYFSNCILKGERPKPDGREGLIDLRIIEAINASITRGTPVPLQPFHEPSRPGMEQQIERPKKNTPELVNSTPPSGN
jgi:predicted dehydrogenase